MIVIILNFGFLNFMGKVQIVVYVFTCICTLFWNFVSFNVSSKLVNVSFCQGCLGWISGSVQRSQLPSAVSQIYERHNYQRRDTQRKSPK